MFTTSFRGTAMLRQASCSARCAVAIAIYCWPGMAFAIPIYGTVVSSSPSGQQLALTMNIDETITTFVLTGPGYSWYSFGFDTVTMEGYSLIIEGTNDNRTAVE